MASANNLALEPRASSAVSSSTTGASAKTEFDSRFALPLAAAPMDLTADRGVVDAVFEHLEKLHAAAQLEANNPEEWYTPPGTGGHAAPASKLEEALLAAGVQDFSLEHSARALARTAELPNHHRAASALQQLASLWQGLLLPDGDTASRFTAALDPNAAAAAAAARAAEVPLIAQLSQQRMAMQPLLLPTMWARMFADAEAVAAVGGEGPRAASPPCEPVVRPDSPPQQMDAPSVGQLPSNFDGIFSDDPAVAAAAAACAAASALTTHAGWLDDGPVQRGEGKRSAFTSGIVPVKVGTPGAVLMVPSAAASGAAPASAAAAVAASAPPHPSLAVPKPRPPRSVNPNRVSSLSAKQAEAERMNAEAAKILLSQGRTWDASKSLRGRKRRADGAEDIEALKAFTCAFCPMAFKFRSDFERHLRSHTQERPYSCKQCGRTFTLKGVLKLHNCSETLGAARLVPPHPDPGPAHLAAMAASGMLAHAGAAAPMADVVDSVVHEPGAPAVASPVQPPPSEQQQPPPPQQPQPQQEPSPPSPQPPQEEAAEEEDDGQVCEAPPKRAREGELN